MRPYRVLLLEGVVHGEEEGRLAQLGRGPIVRRLVLRVGHGGGLCHGRLYGGRQVGVLAILPRGGPLTGGLPPLLGRRLLGWRGLRRLGEADRGR